MGGCSYPGCGTTGDGYSIARRFGHAIVDPRPALVPLRVGAEWVPTLRGLSVPDAVASVYSGRDQLESRREAVLFTHQGLSGPAILDVSRAAGQRGHTGPLVLRLDMIPAIAREELDRRLQVESRQGRRSVISLLPAELPRRLAECLMTSAPISARSHWAGPVARRTPSAGRRAQGTCATDHRNARIRKSRGNQRRRLARGNRLEDHGKPAGPRPLLRRRDPRPGRPDRRL